MDYGQIYSNLIERGLTRTLDDGVYFEKHHVWPKCMGGPDEESNLVILTWPEHRLAHMLLVKMFSNNHKLVYACRAMQMNKDGRKINRKMSEWLKKKQAQILSEQLRGISKSEEHKRKISQSQIGRKQSEKTRRKISEANKGKLLPHRYKTMSDETRRKISEAKKGKPSGNKGKKASEETRRKISESRKAYLEAKKLTPTL
jgi:hypothetical protein